MKKGHGHVSSDHGRLVFVCIFFFFFSCLGGASAAGVYTVCSSGCSATTLLDAVAMTTPNDLIDMTNAGSLSQPTNVNISHSLTIMTLAPINIVTEGGVFLWVYSNLTLEGDFSIQAQAFNIKSGGSVTQTGGLNATFTTATGVTIDEGGVYNQLGPLRLFGIDEAMTGVVNNGEWNQHGSLFVNMTHLTQAPRGVVVSEGGVWRQNGTVQIWSTANAVLLFDGEWYQNEHVSISVATSPSSSLTYFGAIAVGNGVWRQNAWTEVNSSLIPGVVFDSSQPELAQPRWIQRDHVVIYSIGSPQWPITALSLYGAYWEQYANVSLTVSEDATPISCESELWKVRGGYFSIAPANRTTLGACKIVKSFSSSNSTSDGTTTPTTPQQQPILQFDQDTNAVRIVPRVAEGESVTVVEEATVELALAAIREVSADGTVLQVGRATYGAWESVLENAIGASQAFVFSSPITIDDQSASSSSGKIELELFLFDEATNVSVGDVAMFEVLPSLTKLTVAMSSWPWLSNTSRVELSIGVSPPFTRVIGGAIEPSPSVPHRRSVAQTKTATKSRRSVEPTNTTTLTLQGQNSTTNTRSFETQVRFVSVVELDGVVRSPADQGADGRAPVEFSADPESSSLVLSFGYFESDMSYDPDLGVLVGRRGDKDSDGGGDSDAWIIGVAVAVPLAVAFVVVAVAVGLAVGTVRRRRSRRQLRERLDRARNDDHL